MEFIRNDFKFHFYFYCSFMILFVLKKCFLQLILIYNDEVSEEMYDLDRKMDDSE